jgi:hypothetical protein
MSRATPSPMATSTSLSAAERDWIRRQVVSARVQEAERRHLRQRLAPAQVEPARLREQPERDALRFSPRP